MKKTLIALSAVALTLFLGACKGDSYNHSLSILRPANGQYGYVYADQTLDSMYFYTSDTYACSTTDNWITIDPEWAAKTIENQYMYVWQVGVPLFFEPNTTGLTRSGMVTIHSTGEDDWDQQANASYLQLGWHCITHPSPNYDQATYQSLGYPKTCTFELKDSADATVDSLIFYTFDNWTLTTDSKSISLASGSGVKGYNKVYFNIEPNATQDTLRNTITLKTTNGVSTPIVVKQVPAKK